MNDNDLTLLDYNRMIGEMSKRLMDLDPRDEYFHNKIIIQNTFYEGMKVATANNALVGKTFDNLCGLPGAEKLSLLPPSVFKDDPKIAPVGKRMLLNTKKAEEDDGYGYRRKTG